MALFDKLYFISIVTLPTYTKDMFKMYQIIGQINNRPKNTYIQ